MDGVKKAKAAVPFLLYLKNDGTLLSYGTNVSSNNTVSINASAIMSGYRCHRHELAYRIAYYIKE